MEPPPLRSSPKPGLKVVRSREHIPMQERRGSEVSFRDQQQVALVSCASAQSLQGLCSALLFKIQFSQIELSTSRHFSDVVPVLELPAPPDGGWGWVIVFASFMCNLIIDGIAYREGAQEEDD